MFENLRSRTIIAKNNGINTSFLNFDTASNFLLQFTCTCIMFSSVMICVVPILFVNLSFGKEPIRTILLNDIRRMSAQKSRCMAKQSRSERVLKPGERRRVNR